ncbi:MAG: trypsin-like peptidase domain-containing protein [Acidimicrobiia bacterium]|nr:trypsin-like peptidase domain-containing protein [Acidimicrobiia bacterium]
MTWAPTNVEQGSEGAGGWPPAGWAPPPDQSPGPPRHGGGTAAIVAVILIVGSIAVVGLYGVARRNAGLARPPATPTVAPVAGGSAVDAAVVDIVTALGYQHGQAAGTGIVLTPTGEILTNHHVVQGATAISVTDVGNGHTYTGSVVGYDATDDVAVVQLKSASGLKTADLGDSSKLSVGESVLAVGNAGGVGGPPSEAPGAVTALNRSIAAANEDGSAEQLTGLIQTSARLLAGDSGGPLVDSAGRVIGVDTAGSARFTFRNANAGGFAVPINKAMTIARQIVAGHASSTVHIGPSAFLGVEIQPSQSRFGSDSSGADVAGVLSGTTAERAGLGAGDVITSLGTLRISSPTDLSAAMQQHHPGDRVTIGWIDQAGDAHSAAVTLAAGPVG